MRELKFRIWDKTEKEFTNISPSFVCDSQEKVFEFCGSLYQRKNWVIQQFTGLKDYKGTDVYEGDTIQFRHEEKHMKSEVVYVSRFGMFAVVLEPNEENEILTYKSLFDVENFEVVGNIFELPCNPDHNGECLVCDEPLDGCQFLKEK